MADARTALRAVPNPTLPAPDRTPASAEFVAAEGPNDAISAAAIFVLGQPGWVDRTRALCVRNSRGDCASCPGPVRWPCAQIAIANRADELLVVAAGRRAGTSQQHRLWDLPVADR